MPTRMGGLHRMRSKRRVALTSSGWATVTLAAPFASALPAVSLRARSLVSTASTSAAGDRSPVTQAMGPQPHPRSSTLRSRPLSGGASSSSSRVPGSSRPGENTPESVTNLSCIPPMFTAIVRGAAAAAGSASKY